MMKFPVQTREGRFKKRYKRFFADIELDQEIVVAHVANTGSMKSCLFEDGQALLTPSQNPERKLKFTLEALQTPWGSWVGVNTSWPNALVRQVFHEKLNPDWAAFVSYKPEHKLSKETRLDGLLTDAEGRMRFVEVKNVSLAGGDCERNQGTAFFPDAKTERGKKHLQELIALVELGHEAEMIFVVQRTDCQIFQPAWEIDPEYAATLCLAADKGVKISVWPVRLSNAGLQIMPTAPLRLDLARR